MVVKVLALDFRRGDGVAERARLEIACGSKAHRGFESPPLRQFFKRKRQICIKLRICLLLCQLALKCKCLQIRVQEKAKWYENSNQPATISRTFQSGDTSRKPYFSGFASFFG